MSVPLGRSLSTFGAEEVSQDAETVVVLPLRSSFRTNCSTNSVRWTGELGVTYLRTGTSCGQPQARRAGMVRTADARARRLLCHADVLFSRRSAKASNRTTRARRVTSRGLQTSAEQVYRYG